MSLTPLSVSSDELPVPTLPSSLIVGFNVEQYKTKLRTDFEAAEQELLGYQVEMKEVPSTESLQALYKAQVKGRGYFERSSEIYRLFLKAFSTVKMFKFKAKANYESILDTMTSYVRKKEYDAYTKCKGYDERQAMVRAHIPKELQEELLQYEILEQQAQTYFTVVKSYMDNFKSIREEVLVQISIIKSLIALGDLKIDPESVRALRIIEGSYAAKPDRESIQANDTSIPEMSFDEGATLL